MRFSLTRVSLTTLLFLVALTWVRPATAQTKSAEREEVSESVANIRTRIDGAEQLDQAAKDQIAAILATVQANESQIKSNDNKKAKARTAIESVDQTAKNFQSQLEKLKQEKVEQVDPTRGMDSLDAEAKEARDLVAELKNQFDANETASTQRIARRQNSRAQLEEIEKRIATVKAQLKEIASDTSLFGKATTMKLQSELKLAESEKALLEVQLERDDAEERAGVLKKEHDLIELNLKLNVERLVQLEKILASRRQMVAEQLANTAARKQLAIEKSASPLTLLLPSYEVNTELAKHNLRHEKESLSAKQRADKLKKSVEVLEKKLIETHGRVETMGLTNSVGAMLRTRKAELADLTALGVSGQDSSTDIEELQFEIFDTDQLQKDLSAESIQAEVVAAHGEQPESVLKDLEGPIEDVITARLDILRATKSSLNRYSSNLLDIQSNEKIKSDTIVRFREYINERILWIKSNAMLFSELSLDKSDLSLTKPSVWNKALSEISDALIARPALTCLGALVCGLLLVLKPTLRKRIDELGEVAARGSCETFWPTARSMVLSILIAATGPLIPLLVGLAIIYSPFNGSSLFLAIGKALVAAGMFVFPFEALRRMCRPQGLANEHFDWPTSSVSKLKKNLDWIVVPGGILVFIVDLLHNLDLAHRIDLLERVLFIGGMLMAAYFLYLTYNKQDGVFSGYLRSNEKSWANQTSSIWVSMILIVPLSLAFLTFWGYYYTALNLAECAYYTFVFAVAVETFRAMARRLVLVRQRRSFIQAARRKRQAQIEAQRSARKERAEALQLAVERGETLPDEATGASIESFDAMTEMQPEEIAENVVQAQKLISLSLVLVWAVGLWLIWIDVLPALKELDNYTIWPSQVVENGFRSEPLAQAESGGGTTMTPAGPMPTSGAAIDATAADGLGAQPKKRVTVRDLLLFFVIVTVTWILGRSLPSAVEILFLEELPVDRSFRYAIKALTSYAIVVIGFVLAFRVLSISWSSVQWLATALTFGLAFGLQEIFANFVAGIILMFERPMRIGDLITVDEFTGVVTKIRTRATTIINWDRKEYVIPNKDFITGRLVNWTLSDAINRIEFVVGVAYGSDVAKAKSIIYEICSKQPKVVKDPGPQVIFSEFGDSTLNLSVRAFIGEIDCRPLVLDQLHTQINDAFNEAGIEIAFPQRDLNLRTIDGPFSDAVMMLRNQNPSTSTVEKKK